MWVRGQAEAGRIAGGPPERPPPHRGGQGGGRWRAGGPPLRRAGPPPHTGRRLGQPSSHVRWLPALPRPAAVEARGHGCPMGVRRSRPPPRGGRGGSPTPHGGDGGVVPRSGLSAGLNSSTPQAGGVAPHAAASPPLPTWGGAGPRRPRRAAWMPPPDRDHAGGGPRRGRPVRPTPGRAAGDCPPPPAWLGGGVFEPGTARERALNRASERTQPPRPSGDGRVFVDEGTSRIPRQRGDPNHARAGGRSCVAGV